MWIGAIGGQKEKTIKRNRDKNVCHLPFCRQKGKNLAKEIEIKKI